MKPVQYKRHEKFTLTLEKNEESLKTDIIIEDEDEGLEKTPKYGGLNNELPWIPRVADNHKFNLVMNEMLDYNKVKRDKQLERENKMMAHR